MKLLRSFLLALAVALMAACGLDGSNLVGPREDSGTSVTEDRRDPADDSQPDSTPTPDAVIAEDVRPSTDNPVVIIDAGTDGGEDASVPDSMMGTPNCAAEMLCNARHTLHFGNDRTIEVFVRCNETRSRADLTVIEFNGWADCSGPTCIAAPNEKGVRGALNYIMTDGRCSQRANITFTNGTETMPTGDGPAYIQRN
jgi:predicted small lipoprotein YifL